MIKINYSKMRQVCLSPIESFESMGDVYETKDGIYVYKENPRSKILAVAHLDSVIDTDHFHHVQVAGDSIVINAQLDDRLGVYTLMDLLPQLGIEYDLLLTEGEETGRSTARYFESSKEYNWMFSFDRRGDDVVMYQYDNKQLRDDLKQAGLKPSMGSFSDIVFLEHLGIRGINVGTGYHGEHNTMCYANIHTLCKQIKRFKAFYDVHKDGKYPYTREVNYSHVESRFDYVRHYDDGIDCYLCDDAIGTNQIMNDVWLCNTCFSQAGECPNCKDIVFSDEIMDGYCPSCAN